jgi:hypothetical protein
MGDDMPEYHQEDLFPKTLKREPTCLTWLAEPRITDDAASYEPRQATPD